MRRFELTEELLTGVEAIDNHHRALFELANRVVDPAVIKTEGPLFAEAVRFLSDYVLYHFAAEEQVMLDARFPHVESHRGWHDRFKQEIAGYADQAAAVGFTKELNLRVSFAIENWLTEHIRITDRGLADYLKERGEGADVRFPSVRALVEWGKLPQGLAERDGWTQAGD